MAPEDASSERPRSVSQRPLVRVDLSSTLSPQIAKRPLGVLSSQKGRWRTFFPLGRCPLGEI